MLCSEGRREGNLGACSSHVPFDCLLCSEGRREGSWGVEYVSVDPLERDSMDGMLRRDEEVEDDESLPRKEFTLALSLFLKPKPLILLPSAGLDSEREDGDGVKSVKSSFGRLGGSTGSVASPHAGALIRPLPFELTDVVEVPRTLVAAVECDASEVTDSADGLRRGSVGLRGGSVGRTSWRAGVGGGRRSDRRVGKGGGGFLGFTSGFGDTVEGGRGASLGRCSPAGSFPMGAPSRIEPVTL